MDRFLAPHTPEALAHSQLTENWFTWDTEHPSINETLIAGCSSYQAFNRFLSGDGLYILPRSRKELETVLRRYATDAIHNTIARARSPLERGGYSRICHLAEQSISKVLDENDNASHLLDLHRSNLLDHELQANDINSSSRSIRIQ
ncbi:hypothetical protein BXZ70DRAFT_896316 [Cristinia sonorae]|uniref:Uncharacterized protein n=1 Tax=Cristinia sonorae TaxID=1940300 RepID=A0A8K0XNK2_9AGAR|nr:hypothetical protein BXZ70DRAFT_896316 [Cristinia sonorae]